MSDYPEIVADAPPALPPLAEVPWVMRQLQFGRLMPDLDRDRLAKAFGGSLPNQRVVLRWLDLLCGLPKDRFPGGPLWYEYTGDAPLRVDPAVSDEHGKPIGRRLIDPGEVVRANTWIYEGRSDFKRIDPPKAAPPIVRKKGAHRG